MKRIILYVLAYLTAGILIGTCLEGVDIFIALTLISAVAGCLYAQYRIGEIILFPCFAVLGVFLVLTSVPVYDSIVNEAAENGDKVSITAEVIKSELTSYGTRLVVKTENIFSGENACKKKYNIEIYLDECRNIYSGQRMKAEGLIYKPEKPTNPAGFNEYNYYAAQNISLKMYADSYLLLDNNLAVHYLSRAINKPLENALNTEDTAVIKAILFGTSSEIPDEIFERYRKAGVYHLLAISGMHMTLIAGIILLLVGWIDIRAGKIIALGILVLYCIFTGASISTVRATIMLSLFYLRYIFDRDYDLLSSTAFACIVLLIYEPMYLFNVGFQYSFCAVFSISLIVAPICERYDLEGFKAALLASLVLCTAVKPITAYYFYEINLADIISNVILIPFMAMLVSFGIILIPLEAVSHTAGLFPAFAVHTILAFYNSVCDFVNSLEFAVVNVGRPSIIIILMFYAFLLAVAYMFYDKRKNISNKYGIFIVIAVILTAVLLKPSQINEDLKITLLDVGNGDCIVGERKGFCFVIDGGGKSMNSDSGNTGEKILMPYLKSKKIDSIDAVFISHTDYDHIKGILEIIGNIDIEKIYLADIEFDDENYKQLIFMAEKENVKIDRLSAGDKISLSGIDFNCLYPYSAMKAKGNISSLVLRLEYKDFSMLFTGDIEAEGETEILNSDYAELESDVLKLAHHGSKTSSTEEFISRTEAKIAVVSCKNSQSLQHPAPEVVKRLAEHGTALYSTDEFGAIEIKTNGSKITIKGFTDKRGVRQK